VQYVDHVDEDAHPDDTLRAGVVGPADRLERLIAGLRDELGDRALMQHWPAVTASHCIGATTHLLEIFSPETDKWTMVAAYCARRGLKPERVACIGDGLNDVRMVREAGLGIAMGNAMPPVTDVADRVTLDHTDDGVAIAIERILSGAW
jgi:hydroxymethylpyrimidine pyrophosphatase-like HAD family hydrolase